MARMTLNQAIDHAVVAAMAQDERVIVMGEDVPMLRPALFARFGNQRVLGTPISESGFVGAAVGAAMAGLRPIVELMMVDFVAVAFDAVLNQMAKLEAFSGGHWTCPLVVRATSGGGYGDGGQHAQSLWGMLGQIPGLVVLVPSNPADACALMRSAIEYDGPVFFLEPKLLTADWLEFLGRGGRETVHFDVPADGAEGEVPEDLAPVPIGKAAVRRPGGDLTIASLAVGLHRALAAAEVLAAQGVDCEVIDLRSVRPLDVETIVSSVAKTGRLLVVDEDYRELGLSGELAAVALEAGLTPRFARVCVETTLPFARALEDAALPNVDRIVAAASRLTAGVPPPA